MSPDPAISAAIAENHAKFMQFGPGIRDYTVFVLAQDPASGKILLGGLGVLGVGQMWVSPEPRHQDYIGYSTAVERPQDDEQAFFDSMTAELEILREREARRPH